MPVRKQGGMHLTARNTARNAYLRRPELREWQGPRFRLEAHRALELLEDYHAKLTRPQDKQLRLAIERVIRIFKSRLFQALLGKSLYFFH
ncbi:disks large 1 tumor suppressor protein-like [Cardiocondyla obscurior]|uniref:disks large 1 tumor suppressor protein-like n=1 Tax=Cardiocondyla obscurior TaxID=286306 RepID=UPI0039657C4C